MEPPDGHSSSPFADPTHNFDGSAASTSNQMDLDDKGAPHPMAKRWVPHKHSNGVAIYYHENVSDREKLVGGEYMVSSIVRGTPEQCLSALTHAASTTTILGPALACRVLQRDGQDIQVLHITLPPLSGGLASMCAPREAVVQSVLKKEPSGIHMLMFNSLPAHQAHALLADVRTRQVAPVGSSATAAGGAYDSAAGRRRRGHWLGRWMPAGLAFVQGGYTISGLEGFSDDASPESLITCILKVDFGGMLGEHSWLGPIGAALGLTERLTERMLTAVMLIKDEVEQQRFKSYPFALLTPEGGDPAPAASTQPATVSSQQSRGYSAHLHLPSPHSNGHTPPNPAVSGSAVHGHAINGSSQASQSHGVAVGEEGMPCPVGTHSRTGSVVESLHSIVSILRTVSTGMRGTPGTGAATSLNAAGKDAVDTTHAADQTNVEAAYSGTCSQMYWEELHRPGQATPFKVRGANYLADKVKVRAGPPEFVLTAVDLVTTPGAVPHVGRYLHSVRRSHAAFSLVVNLMVPTSTHVMNLVMVFSSDKHPHDLGDVQNAAANGWRPFDHVLHRFVNAHDDERSSIFKLIPHIDRGPWLIQQSVGTVPVMMGRKLKTSYHSMDRYMEIDFDVTSCKAAGYIVSMVKGMTTSLVVDMCMVLEGKSKQELPETLLGAIRFKQIDLTTAIPLDMSAEVPERPAGGAAGKSRQ